MKGRRRVEVLTCCLMARFDDLIVRWKKQISSKCFKQIQHFWGIKTLFLSFDASRLRGQMDMTRMEECPSLNGSVSVDEQVSKHILAPRLMVRPVEPCSMPKPVFMPARRMV